jgi:hypothetical protein
LVLTSGIRHLGGSPGKPLWASQAPESEAQIQENHNQAGSEKSNLLSVSCPVN